MSYVYHMVPSNMKGEVLIPLNDLIDVFPGVYDYYKKKYEGREVLMEEVVPKLNCKWNDLLHFAPVHPSVVYKALKKLGHEVREETKFYKVPIEKLDEKCTVIYKYTRNDAEITDDEIEFLDLSCFEELGELNQATLDWYQYCLDSNRRPLLFHRVPHILTRVKVDVSDCEIVCWSD